MQPASLCATSRGGVHAAKRRGSLGYSVGSNEPPEPSRTLQGSRNSTWLPTASRRTRQSLTACLNRSQCPDPRTKPDRLQGPARRGGTPRGAAGAGLAPDPRIAARRPPAPNRPTLPEVPPFPAPVPGPAGGRCRDSGSGRVRSRPPAPARRRRGRRRPSVRSRPPASSRPPRERSPCRGCGSTRRRCSSPPAP